MFANAWYALFAPAGTPEAIVSRLHAQIAKLLDDTEVKDRLLGLGVEPAPSTPAQLAKLLNDDLARWSKIVKQSGAQLD